MTTEILENASDVLGMSDEDFLENQDSFNVPSSEEEPSEEKGEVEDTSEEAEGEEEPEVEEPSSAEEKPEGDMYSQSGGTEESSEKKKEVSEEPLDYQEFYNKIMTPFKANGKTIELKNPEEAIQLMQMGANYTKKMQAIAPYNKALLMLEKNHLLDEDKLSFLIDLDQKNPEAIQKYLKEAGIDPLDIDVDREPTYKQGNHRVSDQEAALTTAINELNSSDGGQETLQEINSNWDQRSKEALWTNPQLLEIIHYQRQNGVYQQVVDEVDRRRALGKVPASASFLEAYKVVGDDMVQAGLVEDLSAPASVRRVQKPKHTVSSDRRVKAASTTRTTPIKATDSINPLAMSDEEFLKQFANRL